MKKPINKTRNRMESSAVEITANLLELRLLKSLVERLARGRYDEVKKIEQVVPGWQSTETSSIEAYVSVDLGLSNEEEAITMPVITCFFFTCVKENAHNYSMRWVNSLS